MSGQLTKLARAEDAPPDGKTLADKPEHAQVRILVVDDDARNLTALSEVLGDIADVVCANSGEEALRWLLKEQFAVVILDVLMPGMDGYETARLIRTRQQSRQTPIIFLTALNKEDAHLLKGYDSGAVDYVFKPLEPLIVRSKVSVFVNLYEKTMEVERKAAAEAQLLHERLEAQTERTHAVEALREAEARQAMLLRSLPLALYTIGGERGDTDRYFVAGNLTAMTGFTDDVFDNDPGLWQRRIHPDDVQKSRGAFASGERTCEYRWQHSDGSYRYFLDQGVQLTDRPGLVAGTLRDVTEHHVLQEELLQAQKMDAVGKLTGGIAHDFNNLLASVLGGLNLIQRRSSLDAKGIEVVEMTRRAAIQGKQLVDRMLAFSRRQPLSPQTVDLCGIQRSLASLLAPVLGGVVTLRWDVPDRPWPVFVDQSQFELVIMNLVINARDASPQGSNVTIGVGEKTLARAAPDLKAGSYVLISVSDSGSGIPPELLDKVIEPFFTNKEVGKGTGLGLSMAYGFARQSGGTLRIRSTVGVGTVVELWLPLMAGTALSAPVETAAEPAIQMEELTILLIDDSTSLREFTQAELVAAGHHVDVASGGAEALATIERSPERYDVIVSDFAMPAISGLDVIKFARNMRANYPAVLITGYADSDLLTGRPSDVPVLMKPFPVEALVRAIASARGFTAAHYDRPLSA